MPGRGLGLTNYGRGPVAGSRDHGMDFQPGRGFIGQLSDCQRLCFMELFSNKIRKITVNVHTIKNWKKTQKFYRK
jgi:hypothetical protein